MTDGTYTGLDDAAILEHLRTTHANDDDSTDNDSHPSAISPTGEAGQTGTVPIFPSRTGFAGDR